MRHGSVPVATVTYNQLKMFHSMDLSDTAKRILNTPNAGGSSIESEVLSYELFHRCFGARLVKTEMEIGYFPYGGSITDYMCNMCDVTIGVSVTRAFKYGSQFTEEDCERLLTKKLKGVINATRNSLENWQKQILHIWAPSKEVALLLKDVFRRLPPEITSDTIVFITIVESDSTLFNNKRGLRTTGA